MSRRLRDQPHDPVTRAVYWIEYVIRHGGAPHLRSPELDLNWIQLNNLDVVAALLAVLYFIYWLLKKFILCVIGFSFRQTQSNAIKQTRTLKKKYL